MLEDERKKESVKYRNGVVTGGSKIQVKCSEVRYCTGTCTVQETFTHRTSSAQSIGR